MRRYQFPTEQRALLEHSRIPFAVYQLLDKRVVTVLLTDGFCDLFGYQDRGQACFDMDNDMYRDTHPDDVARIADAALRFSAGEEKYDVIYRTRDRSGDGYKIIHAKGEHVFAEDGQRLAYVWYTDEGACSQAGECDLGGIYNSVLRSESALRANYYDNLTGLPNMTYFFELAEEEKKKVLREGGCPAFLFIDLSGMKGFNGKYGFAEGDALLREFSRVLISLFSSENCSRLSQDHFAVCTRAEGLEEKLESLIRTCRSLNEGRTLPVRVGVFLDPKGSEHPAAACDKASYACDELKGSYGSGFRYFTQEMVTDAENRRYLIENLDRALEEGWIQVYYQPIIRAANGRVCDEEALARWIDPVRGFLSPAEFIPVLEDAKLIYKLDLYMLEQVLKKLKAQAAAGLYLVPGSVNISRVDFDACDIVEEIRRRVDEAGVSRELVTIEITESVIGSDLDFIREQVRRFQKLGFSVWMDDFGSGYSSLDVLQSIRFDLIKFDMRFMQRFDQGESSKVVLTELIKLAIGMGIDTICEGVETKEQVEFLREVGCTKLQGYYYCKPIPLAEIMRRYEQGIQIGFEDPRQTDYYAAIGRINLYDLAMVTKDSQASFSHYFNTLPMALMESNGETFSLVRCNNTYRDFMDKLFGVIRVDEPIPYETADKAQGGSFLRALRRCGEEGGHLVVDEELRDGSTAHSILRRIAVNPVTGTKAVAVAVLAVTDKRDLRGGVSYGRIAKALSSDYFQLYYVDLETEQFSEYSSSPALGGLDVERHGEHFFRQVRQDIGRVLYEEDRDYMRESFTREKLLRAMNEHGAFTLTYRLLMDGEPVYLSLKAVQMAGDDRHVIIGVSNVDAQMREKEALERIRAEQVTYTRISALAGNYICIYTVDPATGHFVEYSATRDYEGLGTAKSGEDFFGESRRDIVRIICEEDLELFNSRFTREIILEEIRRAGLYELKYRLIMNGVPVYVSLRGTMVEEKDGPKLVIGVNNIDAQVRREEEYQRNLSVARSRANLDALTGVKNRTAYESVTQSLRQQVEEGRPVRYAMILCTVAGLRAVNEARGRQAGDQRLKDACSVICNIFKHSPVFRVGGDEFAAIAQGHDFEHIDALMESVEVNNRQNRERDGGVLIAAGMARYDGTGSVAEVVETACRNRDEHLRRLLRES